MLNWCVVCIFHFLHFHLPAPLEGNRKQLMSQGKGLLPSCGRSFVPLASVSRKARPRSSPAHLAQENLRWVRVPGHFHFCCSSVIFRDFPPQLSLVRPGEVFSQEPCLPMAQGESGFLAFRGDGPGPDRQRLLCTMNLSVAAWA